MSHNSSCLAANKFFSAKCIRHSYMAAIITIFNLAFLLFITVNMSHERQESGEKTENREGRFLDT